MADGVKRGTITIRLDVYQDHESGDWEGSEPPYDYLAIRSGEVVESTLDEKTLAWLKEDVSELDPDGSLASAVMAYSSNAPGEYVLVKRARLENIEGRLRNRTAEAKVLRRKLREASVKSHPAHLHPCHVTGMHTPNHHLESNQVCTIQMRDIAEQMLAGVDASALPRALHDDCYWCGTASTSGASGGQSAAAEQQAAWARGEVTE